MLLCYTRDLSPDFNRCELTHAAREPIDVPLARQQHLGYEAALREAGARIRRLPPAPEFPDGVFVEDTACVLPEVAVIMRPGAVSRRGETASVEAALSEHREIRRIESPATLDGGDILRVGKTLYVGLSTRSDRGGAAQLDALTREFGYRVEIIEVYHCLHLKSAVTLVAPGVLLVNRDWIDLASFDGCEIVDVAPGEPYAANVLRVESSVICSAQHAETGRRLEALGLRVIPVEVSEIHKAEGGVTCCCIPVDLRYRQVSETAMPSMITPQT